MCLNTVAYTQTTWLSLQAIAMSRFATYALLNVKISNDVGENRIYTPNLISYIYNLQQELSA